MSTDSQMSSMYVFFSRTSAAFGYSTLFSLAVFLRAICAMAGTKQTVSSN